MIRRLGSIVLSVGLVAHLSACSSSPQDCAGRPQVHEGSIEITGAKGSSNLEDLECVQVVTGSVTISDPALSSLEQLGSLVRVSGDVTITNAALRSLRGVERLQEVGGELRFTSLKELESLNGLEGLRKLDGALRLSRLPKLASLEALGALDSIGGSLYLHGLASLVTLEGLGAVAHIGGDLAIDENAVLTDVDALESLAQIAGAYEVSYNRALLSAGFRSPDPSRLPTVGGDIHIFGNASLKTLAGFGFPAERPGSCEQPSTVDGISVSDNDNLEVLDLPDVRNANVSIFDNSRLTTLSSRQNFGTACRLLLSSLPSLTSVSLSGWNMDSLDIVETGLKTLDGLEKTAVSCSLNISKNAALVDAGALSPAGNVAYWFEISRNPSLASCQVQAMLEALPTPSKPCPMFGEPTPGTRLISTKGNNDSAVCD